MRWGSPRARPSRCPTTPSPRRTPTTASPRRPQRRWPRCTTTGTAWTPSACASCPASRGLPTCGCCRPGCPLMTRGGCSRPAWPRNGRGSASPSGCRPTPAAAGSRWPRPGPWATSPRTTRRRTPPRSSPNTATPSPAPTRCCATWAASSLSRTPRYRRPSVAVLLPPGQDLRELRGDEVEERGLLGQPRAGRGVRADQVDALADQRAPPGQYLVAQPEHVVPHVARHLVVVAAGAGYPLLVHQ